MIQLHLQAIFFISSKPEQPGLAFESSLNRTRTRAKNNRSNAIPTCEYEQVDGDLLSGELEGKGLVEIGGGVQMLDVFARPQIRVLARLQGAGAFLRQDALEDGHAPARRRQHLVRRLTNWVGGGGF